MSEAAQVINDIRIKQNTNFPGTPIRIIREIEGHETDLFANMLPRGK